MAITRHMNIAAKNAAKEVPIVQITRQNPYVI